MADAITHSLPRELGVRKHSGEAQGLLLSILEPMRGENGSCNSGNYADGNDTEGEGTHPLQEGLSRIGPQYH